MSDNEDPKEFYGFYGKALDPYDEDSVPKKRPISIEEQVAKDAQGRRRFHGAFTGGFSAGFFNTVGSLEGWRPSEFKSSRSEKAQNKLQRPEDYMDDEDISEFGIAPQTVKATNEYNTSKKRKKQIFSDGPIPGDPVLHTLIESGNETIGYLLLRNMGYQHGDDDQQADADQGQEDEDDEVQVDKKVYGCEMPKAYQFRKTLTNISSNIHDNYRNALNFPKSNTFGMGYSGLDRSHINLFTSSKLVVNERNNKKLSISGQAFGVGAFEDDDEDIYVREDISKYDFELTSEKLKETKRDARKLILDMFVQSENDFPMIEKFLPPTIPASFTGKHKVKKSRFEPLHSTDIDKDVTPKRHQIDAATRANLLGEGSYTNRRPQAQTLENVTTKPQPQVKNECITTRTTSMFDVGPSGLIFDKFVSASKSEEHTELLQPVVPSETSHGSKDMREAARMKMFGPLTRIIESWLPNSLLCKRFNVPEPVFGDIELKSKQRRHRNLIFESASGFTDPPEIQIMTYEAGLQTRNEIAASAQAHPILETISEATTSTSNNTNIANASTTAMITLANVENPLQQLATGAATTTTTMEVEEKKALDPTEKLDISKNVDLFKAVFIDSDSDEADDISEYDKTVIDKRNDLEVEADDKFRMEEQRVRNDEIKARILSEDLLVPQIKPIKHGILSNVESIMSIPISEQPKLSNVASIISTAMSEQPKQTNREEPSAVKTGIIDECVKNSISMDNIYGPRLPAKITYRKPEKSTNLPSKQNVDNNSNSDDWIEKEKDNETKNAKSVKHKKVKKHKKDRHKNKKLKRKK